MLAQRAASTLTERKQREKVDSSAPQTAGHKQQVPDPRRPHGAGGVAADPQGRARRRGGQLPNFLGVLAGSPAALRAYARFRSELRHGHAEPAHARADRARGGRALRLRAGHRRCTRAPRAPGRPRHRRGRAAREWDSGDAARGRAAALPAGRCSSERGRRPACTCTRRRARPAGATSSCSRRSRCCPLEILHRDGQRRRRRPGRRLRRGDAGAARRVEPMKLRATAPETPTAAAECRLLSALPRGGRAGRQALDRRDPRRPAARRRAALLGDRAAPCPTSRDRLLSERMKELEARGHRRAPRQRRARRRKVCLRADRQGPRARARAGRAEGLGGPLVGLTPTGRPAVDAARSTSLPRAMPDRPQTPEDVKALVAERNIRFIRLWFTDILGQLKSFSINRERARRRLRGRDGLRRLLDHRLQRDRGVGHDRDARPDDVRVLPWRPEEQGVARMFATSRRPSATPYEGDPRHVLRRAVERAERDGLRPLQRRPRARVLPLPRQHARPRCSTRAATST